MKKLILLALTAALLLIAAAFLLRAPEQNTEHGEMLVALNEIEQLAGRGDSALAAEKAAALREQMQQQDPAVQQDCRIPLMCGICLLFLGGVTGYCCLAVLRPFEKPITSANSHGDLTACAARSAMRAHAKRLRLRTTKP